MKSPSEAVYSSGDLSMVLGSMPPPSPSCLGQSEARHAMLLAMEKQREAVWFAGILVKNL
jgi:hypothetical protein